MTKLLLINPPSPFLAYPNAAPHLGIGYLLSYVREHGIQAAYLNLETADPSTVVLPEGYDFYGISAVSAQYYFATLLLAQVRQRRLGRTILGGAHASVLPHDGVRDGFDYVVRGYGETALLRILRGEAARGVVQGAFVEDLDALPYPAWDDLRQSDYEISYGEDVAHIFSMRGCPYMCTYCSNAEIFGRRVGFRSVGNVVDEAVSLQQRFGIKRLYFLDPTFTVNRRRALRLAEALRETGLHWTCETRVDRIDRETLQALYRGGCDLISYGIETGAAQVHGSLGKRTTIEQNVCAIAMAHDAGLRVKAFLMGALPGDSRRTVDEYKAFIAATRPDTWLFSTFIPFPGTAQWKEPERFGIEILCRDFRAYYNLGLNGRGPINISSHHLDRDGLQEVRDDLLQFLLAEVPNPRVEEAIRRFPAQKERVMPYFSDLNQRYLF